MKDLYVVCPNCRKKGFVTTDKYNPDIPPNGAMLKSLYPYHLDYLLLSTTSSAELVCPECLAPLVVQGRLCVLYPPKGLSVAVDELGIGSQGKPTIIRQENLCDVCGKSFKTPLALSGHQRSHKKRGKDDNS